MRTVPLTIAKQAFSKLIKQVEQGEEVVITRRGKPIARLVPHKADKTKDPEWVAAYDRLMKRLEKGIRLGGLRINRDELYDR